MKFYSYILFLLVLIPVKNHAAAQPASPEGAPELAPLAPGSPRPGASSGLQAGGRYFTDDRFVLARSPDPSVQVSKERVESFKQYSMLQEYICKKEELEEIDSLLISRVFILAQGLGYIPGRPFLAKVKEVVLKYELLVCEIPQDMHDQIELTISAYEQAEKAHDKRLSLDPGEQLRLKHVTKESQCDVRTEKPEIVPVTAFVRAGGGFARTVSMRSFAHLPGAGHSEPDDGDDAGNSGSSGSSTGSSSGNPREASPEELFPDVPQSRCVTGGQYEHYVPRDPETGTHGWLE